MSGYIKASQLRKERVKRIINETADLLRADGLMVENGGTFLNFGENIYRPDNDYVTPKDLYNKIIKSFVIR